MRTLATLPPRGEPSRNFRGTYSKRSIGISWTAQVFVDRRCAGFGLIIGHRAGAWLGRPAAGLGRPEVSSFEEAQVARPCLA
jgi:hypothetical protein